jgi:hypothetical protein
MGIQVYDYVEITGNTNSGTVDNLGNWYSSDIDSFVTLPAGATAILVLYNNATSAGNRWMGLRTAGKTNAMLIADVVPQSGGFVWVPLGAGNSIETYCEDATTAKFFIVGAVDGSVVWNDVDGTLPTVSSTSGYATRTVTVDAATTAIILRNSSTTWAWRPVGASTSYTKATGTGIVAVDSNDQFQIDCAASSEILAEIRGGITFSSWPPTNETPTADSTWRDSTLSIPAGKALANLRRTSTTTSTFWRFRKNGSSWAEGSWSAFSGARMYSPVDANGNFEYIIETGGTGDMMVESWFDEVSSGGLSITSVDTDNAVLASQSQATFAGTGLASTAKLAIKRGSAIAYATDISLSGSTGGSFTAPTMTAMFSAGVRFGDVAFYAAETSGTAIASISGSITTATNWKYVNVTDLSATGSMGSLFYNNAVSLSDQVAYSSVTTRFKWPVTVSGDGYFTVNSSGSQAGDEFAYRIWDETDSTWGTEGTIEINGGISSAEQVYAAGSLVQVSLESSTLEGATLQ